MKITLPIVTKDELGKDGKRVFVYEERAMEADFSLGMQLRWEAKFPELAAQCSVTDYASRVAKMPSDAASLLSKLKCIYCFLETDMSFLEFIRLFDFTKKEYVQELVHRIGEAFKVMLDGAAEKN